MDRTEDRRLLMASSVPRRSRWKQAIGVTTGSEGRTEDAAMVKGKRKMEDLAA